VTAGVAFFGLLLILGIDAEDRQVLNLVRRMLRAG
jgi:hypothetical protein